MHDAPPVAGGRGIHPILSTAESPLSAPASSTSEHKHGDAVRVLDWRTPTVNVPHYVHYVSGLLRRSPPAERMHLWYPDQNRRRRTPELYKLHITEEL
jgi:hypothetical protein